MANNLEKAVNSYMKRMEELESYYESEDFNQAISIIKRHKKIDQEELNYGTKTIKGLPEERFRKVFETVLHKFESDLIRDSSHDFPTYHIDYKGIRFHLMIGQGSAYWTTKI